MMNLDLPRKNSIRIYSVGVWNGDNHIFSFHVHRIRIYSVGVWNEEMGFKKETLRKLEFTPLEFET